MTDPGLPLMTFALFAYNQEKYICEAVQGALLQDYSPLQIILSDDFSKDRTFEIMQSMVAAYAGPHRVVLNRNLSNLGVADHINKIVEIAEADLIVGAAGDDISMPDRVSETVKAWERSGRKATSIYSAVELIDEDGVRLGIDPSYHKEDVRSLMEFSEFGIGPRGACHTFSRQLMIKFGKLNSDVINEDQVIGFRSALSGKLRYIAKPLVQYRIHGASLTSSQFKLTHLDSEHTRAGAYRTALWISIFRRQNIRDALIVLEKSEFVISILERKVVESEFEAAVLGRKLYLWKVLPSAANAIRRGAAMAVVAKVLVKAAIWPIYARYFEYRRRRFIKGRLVRAENDYAEA